jgi:hypothetical protein
MSECDQRCPVCGRRLTVYCTRHVGSSVIRYIGCRKRRGSGCGWRPENTKVVVRTANDISSSLDNIPICTRH